MKRIIIILVCFVFMTSANAQNRGRTSVRRNNHSIAITKRQQADVKRVDFVCKIGLEPQLMADSVGAGYYVFKCPGETESQLYRKAVLAVGKVYNSPSSVMSTVENKMVTINASRVSMIHNTFDGSKIYLYVKYSYSIEFRDGRIKVNAPDVLSITDRDTYKDFSYTINLGCATTDDNEYKHVYTDINGDVNLLPAAMDNKLSGDDW